MLQKFRSPTPSHSTVAAYVSLFLAAALTLFLGLGAPASANAAEREFKRACARYASDGVRVAKCAKQLQVARDATAKYRDLAVALRDGFVPDKCDDSASEGEDPALGAVGEHWLRVDRMADEKLDPREPEILLYIDTPTGRRLVAVEWSFQRIERGPALVGGLPYYGIQPPDPSRTTPPPKMFGGKTFDGPMQGHHAHQPWHYDLHVWLWEKNPDGIFAHYNPRLSCKGGAAEPHGTTGEAPAAGSDLPVVGDVPQADDLPVAGDLPVVGDVIDDDDDDDDDGDGDGGRDGARQKDRGGLLGGLGL
jgi:hypothetical protein